MDRGDAKRDLLHYNNQAHFGRDPESVFNQIQSDLITAYSYGINMNLLPLRPKAIASLEVEANDYEATAIIVPIRIAGIATKSMVIGKKIERLVKLATFKIFLDINPAPHNVLNFVNSYIPITELNRSKINRTGSCS